MDVAAYLYANRSNASVLTKTIDSILERERLASEEQKEEEHIAEAEEEEEEEEVFENTVDGGSDVNDIARIRRSVSRKRKTSMVNRNLEKRAAKLRRVVNVHTQATARAATLAQIANLAAPERREVELFITDADRCVCGRLFL